MQLSIDNRTMVPTGQLIIACRPSRMAPRRCVHIADGTWREQEEAEAIARNVEDYARQVEAYGYIRTWRAKP